MIDGEGIGDTLHPSLREVNEMVGVEARVLSCQPSNPQYAVSRSPVLQIWS